MTFFDWPAVRSNSPGAGSVALTSFRVPNASFGYWMERLGTHGIDVAREPGRLIFADPEGQRLALVADDGLPAEVKPWTAIVPEESAIRGILGVDIDSRNAKGTAAVLTEILGFTEVEPGQFEVATENSIGRIKVNDAGNGRMGMPGAGGVHHVAFRAKDDDHLNELMAKVEAAGIRTSGYVNRFYFHSLYFREPGGVLFEIATDGPGMHQDEELAHLGEKLALPPFLEARRAEIEAGLKPIPNPAYLAAPFSGA